MNSYPSKPGPPPALEVEILQPDPANNPILVQNGMIRVEVKATGGTVNRVDADTFTTVEPAALSFQLVSKPGEPDVYEGHISAPCSPAPPFPKFKIKALAEFANPSGNPMDPPEEVTVIQGDYEGQCEEMMNP